MYPFTGNYYNWLAFNLTKFKLDLDVNENFVNYLTNDIDKNLLKDDKVDISVKMFYDTSIYNNKVYLYFGITPIILFYLPFYLATNYFVSDHLVILFLSIFIFILQILIYKKISILSLQNKKLTVIPVLIFGLCSGILLTYVSITIHLIAIFTCIFCSLVALHIFLLLSDDKYKNLKMFLLGLFLAFAIGARLISVILTMFIFIATLTIDSKKYIFYSSKLQNFKTSNLLKKYSYFFLPLIIYGIILALYNYLRFDSIFDFGFKYQFSPNHMVNITKDFYFVVQHLFYNIFYIPKFITINPYVIFNNASINNFEPLIGGFIIAPIIISLIGLLKFNFLKNYKLIFLFFIVTISTSFIYLCIDSYKGSNARFVTEYLFLLLVPSLFLFYNFMETENNFILKNIIKILFLCLTIFSLYINTNLINCIFLMSKNGVI